MMQFRTRDLRVAGELLEGWSAFGRDADRGALQLVGGALRDLVLPRRPLPFRLPKLETRPLHQQCENEESKQDHKRAHDVRVALPLIDVCAAAHKRMASRHLEGSRRGTTPG